MNSEHPSGTTNSTSELEYSSIFYVLKTDLQGNYTYVNAIFAERFAFLSTDFIGKPSLGSIDERDHARCLEAVRECLERPGRVVPVKLRKPSQMGGSYWTQWEFSAVLVNGVPQELLCVGFDISDQENQLQALIENSLDLIFVVRPDGELEEYFVPDFDGFVGDTSTKNAQPLMPDLTGPYFQDALRFTIEKGKMSHIEYELERNGTRRWYIATAVRFFYRQQDCVLWVARDITGLKDAQRQAEDHARHVDQILESITDGFCALDRNWQLVRVNQRFAQMHGKEIADMQGQTLWDFMPTQLLAQGRPVFEAALYNHKVTEIEYYEETADRWYNFTIYPAEEGLTIYAKDNTERKKAELRVIAQNQQLRHIAYLQSHEVRAPVAALMGLASLLEDENLTPGVREMISQVKEQANRLNGIISEIVKSSV